MLNFIVDKKNIRITDFEEVPTPSENELQDGEVLLKIDKFSFTSNNTTYAVLGFRIGYWNFFPSQKGDEWGIIPCWGFADVVASKHEEVEVGDRFYGYYPMGSHLVVQPGKIRPMGFADMAPHRGELPPIYNFYNNTKADPGYHPKMENLQALFRPLFFTSFLLDDFFHENKNFGAQNIILTSASSKTALGLAFLEKSRVKNGISGLKIIGLTSPRNMDFVKNSRYYDEVYTYDDVKNLPQMSSTIVDFSGNSDLQYELQTHLGEHLKYNSLVGMVHWEEMKGTQKLPKRGEVFFAPSYAQQRIKEWGVDTFYQNVGKAAFQFNQESQNWLVIQTQIGKEALQTLHQNMIAGNISPKDGHIVQL